CTHSVATQLSDEGQRYRRISLARMCHSFIAIVLQAFASGVCIVSAPVIARLLKMFSRSSLCDFIKYVLVRQVLKGHPSVTVRLGAVHGRECSFNCYQHSLQQRFLHDGCCEGGICLPKSTRHYKRFAFSQHRQAGHEVNRLCEAGRTDLLHQLRLRAHAFFPITPPLHYLERLNVTTFAARRWFPFAVYGLYRGLLLFHSGCRPYGARL